MLERIMATDPVGVIFMVLAAVMVYGAKFIVLKVFKFPREQSTRPLVSLKLVGLIVGIAGMLKIFGII